MAKKKSDLMHGTLALLILKLVEGRELNGYAIGLQIRAITDEALNVDEGSLYPALYRMERQGWLVSAWGMSENNRRAKFYSITKLGLSQLGLEASNWAHFSDAVGKILDSGAQ